MSACRGCGGTLGLDCWNESECVWIHEDMMLRGQQALAREQAQAGPCQGCSEVTGQMRECIGVCEGLRSWGDVEARAEAWRAMLTTVEVSR